MRRELLTWLTQKPVGAWPGISTISQRQAVATLTVTPCDPLARRGCFSLIVSTGSGSDASRSQNRSSDPD